MTDLFAAKFGAVAALGKAVLPPCAVIMAEVNGYIDEKTAVPLSVVVGIGAACWYLIGRFTKIETKLDDLAENISSRPCQSCPAPSVPNHRIEPKQ